MNNLKINESKQNKTEIKIILKTKRNKQTKTRAYIMADDKKK